jgi:drug/metabolite transporter (DMT)-like permease
MMNGWSRGLLTLLGAAGAGVLLWAAAQIGRDTTWSYWAAYAVVAAAGLVLAVSQLRGRTGHPPAMFLFGLLPVAICGGWVLVAMQPHDTWLRGHILTWSSNIGIHGIVMDLGTWIGVLAFGIGYTLGATLEPMPVRAVEPVEPATAGPTYDRAAADEPTAAERREVVTEREAHPVR